MKAETKLSLTPSKCDDIEFFGEKMNVCADETLTQVISRSFKSSSGPSHYIFEINVGKSRIRRHSNSESFYVGPAYFRH